MCGTQIMEQTLSLDKVRQITRTTGIPHMIDIMMLTIGRTQKWGMRRLIQ